jgi:general stress protein 26
MSYSNADTRSKPADPYKEKIPKKLSLKDKVEDLVAFADKCKFCMMTTRMSRSRLLVSRCIALAAKVCATIHPRISIHPAWPLSNCQDIFIRLEYCLNSRILTFSETIGRQWHRLALPRQLRVRQTDNLTSDPDIRLLFLTPSGELVSISGKTLVETDCDIVKKFYSPALKAWIGDLGDGKHDGGPDDPRICVIRVKAITTQYAIGKISVVGVFVELAKEVTTGEAPNVNCLRQLSEKELAQCE